MKSAISPDFTESGEAVLLVGSDLLSGIYGHALDQLGIAYERIGGAVATVRGLRWYGKRRSPGAEALAPLETNLSGRSLLAVRTLRVPRRAIRSRRQKPSGQSIWAIAA